MMNSRFFKFEKKKKINLSNNLFIEQTNLGMSQDIVLGGDDGFKTIILLFQHSLQLMCVAPFSLSSIASTDCREYPR